MARYRKPLPRIDPDNPLMPPSDHGRARYGKRPIRQSDLYLPEPVIDPSDVEALQEGFTPWRDVDPKITGETPVAAINHRLIARTQELIAELTARQSEALHLFEPLTEQARFLRSHARTRVYRGGNRAGKTTIGAVDCGMALMGKRGLHGRWPEKDGVFIVVGYDLEHCAIVVHPKLFHPGAFRLIRDEETKAPRAFRPWAEYDHAYREQAYDAPPLIPERYLAAPIVWEDKGKGIPKLVKLVTGWQLRYYSSNQEPRQGIIVDGWWFDEEIQGRRWLPETQMRCLDHHGRGYWTATPKAGTPELVDLKERADDELERKAIASTRDQDYQVAVEEFSLSLTENPHISEDEVREASANLANDMERDVCIHGGFAAAGFRVFPEFYPKGRHGIAPFEIPGDWTYYYTLDPGRQVCAAFLWVVANPDDPIHGGHVYGIDELYIRENDVTKFGLEVRKWYSSFLIERHWKDNQYGRQVGPTGKSNAYHYEEELKRLGLGSQRTGHYLEDAPANPDEGIDAIRAWLAPIWDGLPKFRVFHGRMPNLIREAARFPYKKDPKSGMPTNKPDFGRYHACDCWRYAALLDPPWVRPRHNRVETNFVVEKAEELKARYGQAGSLAGSIRLG